jgi:hypothetical protein
LLLTTLLGAGRNRESKEARKLAPNNTL